MMGPTWADVAGNFKKTERRDVPHIYGDRFSCPFCGKLGYTRLLKHATGHRCNCGALFYTQQAVAVHFKEREQ